MTDTRAEIRVRGIVQGVGFRPFVYRVARSLNLRGFVKNNSDCVFIEVEGSERDIEDFIRKIREESPPASFVREIDFRIRPVRGYTGFEILPSDRRARRDFVIPPDIAICEDCKKELLDPSDRRYYYPFINCTSCGPRYTIIRDLPYDRPNTTMEKFEMCDLCRAEYEDPLNRRFHAQPNACPVCGPEVVLLSPDGVDTYSTELIKKVAGILRSGEIVAIRGLGGFHLACDARNTQAVSKLREIKGRGSKPFAIMVPDLEWAHKIAEISKEEEVLLKSWQAPIVLLGLRKNAPISKQISPGLDTVGIMLPYTPLHLLILKEFNGPLVMTSGNVSENPIISENEEMVERFKNRVRYFLLHNRDIHMRIDDSVARVVKKRVQVLRRARGFVPLPVNVGIRTDKTILALGPLLKNTFTFFVGDRAYMSQYIGDLDSIQNLEYMREVLAHFSKLFELEPDIVACDMHPEYPTTEMADSWGVPVVKVQHHMAHILSVVGEKNLFEKRILGFAFDGTGYGTDGRIWGGEVFLGKPHELRRVAHFRYFFLPTGEAAVKQPWRIVAGFLKEIFGEPFKWADDLPEETLDFWKIVDFNRVETSSVGRLFDAFASLLGIRHHVEFEAQAAMELEALADKHERDHYEISFIDQDGRVVIDSFDFFSRVFEDRERGEEVQRISAKIHNTFVWIIERIKEKFRGDYDVVVYSGGVFQNRYILEKLKDGYFNEEVPINDGGVSLGQAIFAALQRGG